MQTTKAIDFKSPTNKLNDVLFDVDKLPLYVKPPNQLFEEKIKNYLALYNKRDGYVLSLVSSNYHLITNEKALNLGKRIFTRLFDSVKEDINTEHKLYHQTRKNSTTYLSELLIL